MRRLTTILMALLLAAGACSDGPAAPEGARPFAECGPVPDYVPTSGWRSACPSALGMDSARLRQAVQVVERDMRTVHALAVARRGYVVLEAYWHGSRASTPIDLRSVTKAVTAGVVATSIAHGRLGGVEVPLAQAWPRYFSPPDDPRMAQLTVRHLLDLTAGYQMNTNGRVRTDYVGWALTRPMQFDPGTRWQYDEPLYHVLSSLVREVDARGLRGAARDDLFAPLGIAGAATRWPLDQAGNAQGASGLRLTARELLSLGELHRLDGAWGGRQLLPAGWVPHLLTRPESVTSDVALWSRGWRNVVLDGHVALVSVGYGGQYLVVIPDVELVVAVGADSRAPTSAFPAVLPWLREQLLPAVFPAPTNSRRAGVRQRR